MAKVERVVECSSIIRIAMYGPVGLTFRVRVPYLKHL
jgi:hypothetical protein